MRRIGVVVLVGATAAVAALTLLPASAEEAPAKERRPLVTWWGAHSRIEETAYHRVTTAAEWQALWTRHAGEHLETGYRIPKFPEVDFDQCMVVAILPGKTWNTRGVAVPAVTEEKDLLRIRFDTSSLSYQTHGEGDRVTPYALCVLPKSSKPVVVEENVHSLKNEGPRWKERARFD